MAARTSSALVFTASTFSVSISSPEKAFFTFAAALIWSAA